MCHTKNTIPLRELKKLKKFKPVFQENGDENQNSNSNIFWPKPIPN